MAFSGKDSRARSRQRAFRRSCWSCGGLPRRDDQVDGLAGLERAGAGDRTQSDGGRCALHRGRRPPGTPRRAQGTSDAGLRAVRRLRINPRHDAKIKDDEPDSIPPSGEELEQPLAHVFDVEVQQGRLTANQKTPGVGSFSGCRPRSAKWVVSGIRASSATWGWEACRSSSTIEMAAPNNTPLTGPIPVRPQTPPPPRRTRPG